MLVGFTDQSTLLKHELAYVLGQMKNPSALPTLERVLRNLEEDPMVRHEAAEAMGAISSMQSIPTLKELLHDERREVRETCEIALAMGGIIQSRNDKTSRGEPVDLPVYGYLWIHLFFMDSSHLKSGTGTALVALSTVVPFKHV